jgi:aspartate/methionine/tyrosine aminotransferase
MLSPSFYEKMAEVMSESNIQMHQYARSPGHLPLVHAVAKAYSPFFNRQLDPVNEILISIGGDGAVNNAITSFLDEGDEVTTPHRQLDLI